MDNNTVDTILKALSDKEITCEQAIAQLQKLGYSCAKAVQLTSCEICQCE